MPHVYRTKDQKGKPHPRWRFQYTDWQGKRRTATGHTSKTETEKLAASVQAKHDEIRRGYREPPRGSDTHRRRSFAEVLEEYLSWGATQGGRRGRPWGREHARKRRARLVWWHKRLGFETLADAEGSLPRVEEALRELSKGGRAGKTVHAYAEALKSFATWCVDRGYLAENPLKALAPFDTTPMTRRRSLKPDEVKRLVKAAPRHRQLLYETAICSGLRAGELRALKVDDLDEERMGLHLRPEWTKNRQAGFQPLPTTLVKRLMKFVEEGRPKALYMASRTMSHRKEPIPDSALLYVPRKPDTCA